MKTTRFAPWMCFGCGYTMDAASSNKEVVPTNGSVALCLNCGCEYVLREDRWLMLSAQERDALPAYLRRSLLERQIAMRLLKDRMGMTDLSKRDHWT